MIYVVPTRRCQGRHFFVKSHLHAESWKIFQQRWTLAIKMIKGKNMPASTSRCRCQKDQGPNFPEFSMENNKGLIHLSTRLRVFQDTAMASAWPAKCFANSTSESTTETHKRQEMRKVYELNAVDSATLRTFLRFTTWPNFPQCRGQDGLRV